MAGTYSYRLHILVFYITRHVYRQIFITRVFSYYLHCVRLILFRNLGFVVPVIFFFSYLIRIAQPQYPVASLYVTLYSVDLRVLVERGFERGCPHSLLS